MRYPYVSAGQVAAPIFGAASLVLAWVLWTFLGGLLPLELVLAAAIASVTGFHVFASQSRERPPSLWQASVADGLIAGIISGVLIGLIISLIAHRAGGSHSSSVVRDTLAATVLSAVGAGAGGALCGYIVLLAGGEQRLSRISPSRSRTAPRHRAAPRRRKR